MLGVGWRVLVGVYGAMQLQEAFGMGRTENEHKLCGLFFFLRLAGRKKILGLRRSQDSGDGEGWMKIRDRLGGLEGRAMVLNRLQSVERQTVTSI